MEYPYQLTTFLSREPLVGEPVYNGKNGWYSQIALKRRFKIDEVGEDQLISSLQAYCASQRSFTIRTGSLAKPERMPVQIVEVEHSQELIDFHLDFIVTMGNTIKSRYPERDGDNYLPHITAEYDGRMVINPSDFIHKDFTISKVWLLKDVTNQDSQAYKVFNLGS